MRNKYFFYTALALVICISSCKDNGNPTSSDKPLRTVRYYAYVTPVSNANVSKTFIYTNENGGTSQLTTGNGTFDKTIKIASGKTVELKASGSTSLELYLSARAIIYVEGNNIAESNANSKKYSNSVSVSAVVP